MKGRYLIVAPCAAGCRNETRLSPERTETTNATAPRPVDGSTPRMAAHAVDSAFRFSCNGILVVTLALRTREGHPEFVATVRPLRHAAGDRFVSNAETIWFRAPRRLPLRAASTRSVSDRWAFVGEATGVDAVGLAGFQRGGIEFESNSRVSRGAGTAGRALDADTASGLLEAWSTHLHRGRALSKSKQSSSGQRELRGTDGWLSIRGEPSSRRRRQLRSVRGLEEKGSSGGTTRVRVPDTSASRGREAPRGVRFGSSRRRRGCGQFARRSVFRVERRKRPRGRCDGVRSTPEDRPRVDSSRRSSTGVLRRAIGESSSGDRALPTLQRFGVSRSDAVL